MNNIFNLANIDFSQNEEIMEILTASKDIRIERIVSFGQTTAINNWYDQNQNEFVIVLQGEARIMFDNGQEKYLSKGDYILIPSHVRHRVDYTSTKPVCIWLAVFFNKNKDE
ncbi:MAG: cupin domain-containing protein [Bacteroidales bacterium]|jgi:cupin 2 domain-containing protein|nr:cupin domain-containing protein [Bacteroidales bacterium]